MAFSLTCTNPCIIFWLKNWIEYTVFKRWEAESLRWRWKACQTRLLWLHPFETLIRFTPSVKSPAWLSGQRGGRMEGLLPRSRHTRAMMRENVVWVKFSLCLMLAVVKDWWVWMLAGARGCFLLGRDRRAGWEHLFSKAKYCWVCTPLWYHYVLGFAPAWEFCQLEFCAEFTKVLWRRL